ncbi:MFS transporter [Streptomyces longwoodensis]|uniref:MFS transporter n=1 Tax=Streptomyces longwoodensis TaxID=68231 RepID=UPI002DDB6B13|nr:MFS transporter [Streptomyces longwoodensis]WRY92871.1 MFS transporter [Streptomyces longwoodensis]
MMCAVSMTFIDQTIVSIAAPSIVSELGLSGSGMQWVVNAYLLSLAAFFALGGRLADLWGPRRVVVLGTLVFVVSSALCGCVPAGDHALAWLIVFRATQGLGAALLFPAALAVVVAVFPVERRGRALALFFGLTGALTAIGPLLGGWLTAWTWRAIFWVNVPVAVVALVLTVLARISDRRRDERLDGVGAVLVAVGMGLSVLGFQQASAWGWSSAATWGCIVGGLAVLVVFCRYELRTRHPLITLAVFRDRAFTVDALVLFFAMTAFVPLFFFASVYAQVSLSASPNQAALYLLYVFAGFALASQWGGRILDKRGARPALKTGCVVGAVGFYLWAGKLTDLSMHDQWPYAALAGAGIGFVLAPASTDAVNRSIDASYGEVTGITQTVRNYAASIGLAVFGTLLTHSLTDHVVDTLESRGLSSGTAHAVSRDVAQAVIGNPDAHRPGGDGATAATMRDAMASIRMDFAEANQWVFYGMAAAMALAFLVALRHPGGVAPAQGADAASEGASSTGGAEPGSSGNERDPRPGG